MGEEAERRGDVITLPLPSFLLKDTEAMTDGEYHEYLWMHMWVSIDMGRRMKNVVGIVEVDAEREMQKRIRKRREFQRYFDFYFG